MGGHGRGEIFLCSRGLRSRAFPLRRLPTLAPSSPTACRFASSVSDRRKSSTGCRATDALLDFWYHGDPGAQPEETIYQKLHGCEISLALRVGEVDE